MRRTCLAVFIIVTIMLVACSQNQGYQEPQEKQEYTEYQEEVTLIVPGAGYEIGDIVLLDTQKEPELGDVVLYDYRVNKSGYGAFGPGTSIAKIMGIPGDKVRFSECSYEANGHTVSLRCGPNIWPTTKLVAWGSKMYESVVNLELEVPEGEYLADKVVGFEPGEMREGNRVPYSRLTIKQEAIKGVILKKLGHDKEFAERQKEVVY